jgi:hypothetical protein
MRDMAIEVKKIEGEVGEAVATPRAISQIPDVRRAPLVGHGDLTVYH